MRKTHKTLWNAVTFITVCDYTFLSNSYYLFHHTWGSIDLASFCHERSFKIFTSSNILNHLLHLENIFQSTFVLVINVSSVTLINFRNPCLLVIQNTKFNLFVLFAVFVFIFNSIPLLTKCTVARFIQNWNICIIL